ncbi:aldehyde dehydrogenase [Penicillium longicatenatum]|uniref:aldehyde dehydrogenase n=1 Tax=Penicillium longicatenatum TaxID=1561947 RepID=UPI0025471D11|nr:aldehyde dehydrogenase [Penicillium longicatenatum]KAJ5642872.1 aldehyde dehydrogenase [Penicillium longicatenatum]
MLFQVAADGRNVVPLVVNGEPLPINESKLYPVVSARTNKTVHYYQSASTSDCSAACDAAWQAFSRGNDKNGPWKRVGVEERRSLLENVASLIIEREETLVKAQMEETSSGALWARMNVQTTAKYVRELAACVSSIRGTIPPNDKPNTMAFVYQDAVGPVLIIPPWNAALNLCTRALAAAIGAGCTTVLKASELCPYTHTLIAEISLMLPILLELGGKCPAIVLDDADLEKAAQKCAMGILIHHGQICFGTERIIVQRKVAEPFTNALIATVKTFEGTPEFAGTAVSEQIARHALIEDRLNSLVPAIVVVDVNMDANEVRIVDEETFGPSASLYIVNTDEEAIELANQSAFGLNATFHTQDLERGMRVGRELEYGQVHLNWETVYVTRELFSFTRSIVWN